VDEIFVSGGGAKNKTIMKSLAGHFEGTHVGVLDELGISGDAKEAMCFAILANETIAGNPANILGATGAHKQVVLGTISRPLS
jgi:anhydro-N-acetylmuramic acid kinase